MTHNTVLIAGATGVVGRAALEHFLALPHWNVVALSRRKPDVAGHYEHLAVDLTDAAACAAVADRLRPVTHLVYAALYEKPGLVRGWRERDQMQTNLAMLQNLMQPLLPSARGLRHVSLLQGTKAYGAHLHPIAVPAREDGARDPHDNFYWLQEDFVRRQQQGSSWHWTILRPQIVFGHALHSPMNLLAAIGAYAAIRKALGLPFGYPGGAPYVAEAIDARLLAEALAWAATTPTAANHVFNIANGDVFVWRNLWPALAQALDVEPGEPAPLWLAREMPQHAALWQEIVARHGLRPTTLEDLVGYSFHYADFVLAPGQDTPPPPVIVSTVKIRQAGFAACVDTETMLREWFAWLRRERFLP